GPSRSPSASCETALGKEASALDEVFPSLAVRLLVLE
ncbi:hypothetical protein L195_g064319, partial [Trifolium pratense]